CEYAEPECRVAVPLLDVGAGRAVRCVRWKQAAATKPGTGADLPSLSLPGPEAEPSGRDGGGPVLEADHLRFSYRHRGHETVAVSDLSFSLARGRALGV